MPLTSNLFEDLDDLTLSYLLRFAKAPDALRLGVTSKRFYQVYRSTTKLRHFKHCEIVRFNVPNFQPAEMQLQSGPTPKTDRIINVEFWTESEPAFLTKSDLVIEDGEVVIRIEIGNCWPQMWPRVWRCHINHGEEREATKTLMKFFTEHFALDELEVSKVDTNGLSFVAEVVPAGIERVILNLSSINTEDDVLHFIERAPSIRKIDVNGEMSDAFSLKFFEDENVRRLRDFSVDAGPMEIGYEEIQSIHFMAFAGTITGLTPIGLQKILEEWKEDRREIESWFLSINCDPWIWTFRNIVKLLLGGSFYGVDDMVKIVVNSKSGKAMEVKLDFYEDRSLLCVDFVTV